MLDVLINNQPPVVARLWAIMTTLAGIPRQSGDEKKVREYLLSWARQHKLTVKQDRVGNVLMLISPNPKLTKSPGLILQSHMDMVCVGTPSPAKHGVKLCLSDDDEWLTGDNTSAGFDNGIGLSAALALSESTLDHGPLALLFTTSEETGFDGALGVNFPELHDYRYLLNLDWELEGAAGISSAGGCNSIMSLPLTWSPSSLPAYTISVAGLPGGHSGTEIGKSIPNAIKMITILLLELQAMSGKLHVAQIQGGVAMNAIPSDCIATVCTDLPYSHLKKCVESRGKQYTINRASQTSTPVHEHTQQILSLLSKLPHGVLAWEPKVDGLVQLSTNLATIQTTSREIKVEMMSRCAHNQQLDELLLNIRTIATTHHATTLEVNRFPGWPAEPDSELIKRVKKVWQKLAGQELLLEATHAGLECGAIMGKLPHLEAISIGPTILDPHTIKERVKIATVTKFCQLVESLITDVAISG